MSGHSKWSKVKHQKEVTDAVKSSSFTRASRAITVAVREGGGITDPSKNFRLRLAVDKARSINMPKETIERAIAKAAGADIGQLTEATYGAFGPGQVAFLIESLTDNPNRTVSAVKNILEHNGGRMVDRGAVSHLFEQKGIMRIPREAGEYDRIFSLCIEKGAEDLLDDPEEYSVITAVPDLARVKDEFERAGVPVKSAEILMKPVITTAVDAVTAEKISRLIDELEELDDVQRVYDNSAEGGAS